MARVLFSRLVVLSLLVTPIAAETTVPRIVGSTQPGYSHVATLPSAIDGFPLKTFATDRKANRLYAGSIRGLYWVGLSEFRPVWKRALTLDITHIEFAPEVNRVLFSTRDDIGYVNVNALEEPHIIGHIRAHDFAYEPTRRDIYVSSRDATLEVFNAETGERSTPIALPGWQALELESVPGRLFLTLQNKDGLYAVDAATHTIAPWAVSEKIVTPAHLEADPAGKFLFLSFYQNVVGIDAATGKLLGRVTTPGPTSIAFDPDANLLVATYVGIHPELTVSAFRADEHGLTEVASMENPAIGGIGVEPTSRGFIQFGVYSLLVWTLNDR